MNRILPLLLATLALLACTETTSEPPEEQEKHGYEILQVLSPDEIVVWINNGLTPADFEAIELPSGWFKNQPREGDPDGGWFHRSPNASADGEFHEEEHFGHVWMHNATIIEANTALDPDGLLRANRIAKHHTVTFDAGRTLYVLVSPDNVPYLRITRDANRTSDDPTLPGGWRIVEHVIDEALELELPNPTVNIRCDNEDSFQGPVAEFEGLFGEAPPLALTPDLCDDPGNMAALMEAFGDEDSGSPSFGEVNQELMQELLMAPTEGPFYMVNLIRFREWAVYPDGRETDLTGREANDLYDAMPWITAIGARAVFVGEVSATTYGQQDEWDQIAIVEYPCPLALLAMSSHPGFQATEIHKEAALEASIVMVTHLQPLGEIETAEPPFPATADDPAFDLVQVFRHREQAEYPAGSGEPDRTGEEAMDLYASGIADAQAALGISPVARLEVQGAFIGDGREWDEVWIDRFPSGAAYEALTTDPAVEAASLHFDAALAEGWGLQVAPLISDVPDASGQGEPTPPPVTADGTGTLCQQDADCPGDGVELCLSEGGGAGFCTREGCGAGECQAPYLCCHSCSPMAAPMLPFEGSACLPGDDAVTSILTGQAGCTCD